jgi:outer membrane protein assembly factor BamB
MSPAGRAILTLTLVGGILVTSTTLVAQRSAAAGAASWRQWGGPNRDFISESTGLADAWPDAGPPVIWSRPLGGGYAAITVDDGRLFTMFRVGNGRTKGGPWEAEESVVALEAATGKTIWEYKYPSARTDFSQGAGPHSTPLVVGDRVFTLGTNNQLYAFDKRTGKVLWSHDLVKEFNAPSLLIRPMVKVGYGCSFIAYGDTIICTVGGPGQSVMAFRQSDGSVAWKSGDFLNSDVAPILITLAGRQQLVFVAGGTVQGMDPANGQVLWAYPHDPGNDLNCMTPLWGPDNILFVSSAYQAGSRAIQLRQEGDVTHADELWFTNRVRFMFLSAYRLGDYVYGTTGDTGPAFLTALDIKTGKSRWQARGFARASLLYADGKTIVMDEDGDLALAKLTPEGATILSQFKLFETVSWTVPTLVGTTLYARDREKIVALNVGKEGQVTQAAASAPARPAPPAPAPPARLAAKPVQSDLPAFGGWWKLDPAQSQVSPTAGLTGLIASGAPDFLFITQPANGTLLVESMINTMHVRMYRPGGKTSTPAGQGGSVTMTSRWDGRTLVSEGSLDSPSNPSVAVKELISLAADGKTLTIDVTTTTAADTASSSLKYTPTQDVGPCESWTTPCKEYNK